mmetsp:Transcript_42007/g.115949  ORF Transcript_42007/g.115949 Transcript_42007/m.115949 type:complete len:912 (-) Transcript_42007:58-2793(-)
MASPGGLAVAFLLYGLGMVYPASALTDSCPTELFNLPSQWNSMQQQKACRDIILAAVASDAAYSDKVQQFLQDDSRPEAGLLKPIEVSAGSASFFDAPSTDTVIVAFRGTSNLTDVWTNVQYYQTDALSIDVHAGFYQQSLDVKLNDLVERLVSGKRILICGHSLGGAVAKVLTLRLLNEGRLAAQYRTNQRVQCVTFGAALVAASVPGYDPNIFLNLVNENDLIPKLLLLKGKGLEMLGGAFAEMGLWSMLEGLAQQWYDQSSWYVKLAASFAKGHLDAYWGSDSDHFPYTPFGYFIFLGADGDSHKVRLASSSSDVRNILCTPEVLKSFSAFQQALKDHRIANYAEAVERIRTKSPSTCQGWAGGNERSCRTDPHFDSSADANFFRGAQVVGFGNLVSFPATGMTLNFTTLDWLTKLAGPFYSVVCAGEGRSGKSLILSLIAGAPGLFPSSDSAHAVTEGLDVAVIRVRGAYVLLVDAEGGDNALAEFHAVVNVMGLLLGQVLIWVTGGTIGESAISLLGQMIASSALINFHGGQQKSSLVFVANKCTLRLTDSNFEESLATLGDESARAHARNAIQDRFPQTNRSFFRLPLRQDSTFREEFASLLDGLGGRLTGISPLSLDAIQLDGRGVASFLQMIFDSVRDTGSVDMPSVVESVLLDGYLIPEAKRFLNDLENQLPHVGLHGTCIANVSAHDSRAQALHAYANTTRAKLPKHTRMIERAQSWLQNELARVWILWEANNTMVKHAAIANVSGTMKTLAQLFEDGLPKSGDYIKNLNDYDNREWFLQQFDVNTSVGMSCLPSEIRDSRVKLLRQLTSSWTSFADLNQAVGKQLSKESVDERTVFIGESTVLCGCRRRRRHYKQKQTFIKQTRSKYLHKDGTISHSAFNEGVSVHKYPHGDCGNHPEVR